MKNVLSLLVLVLALLFTSCAVHITDNGQAKKSSAPGQVKKQSGSQSAKQYAPGQNKKGN